MRKLLLIGLSAGVAAITLAEIGNYAFSQAPSEIIGCVYNSSLPTLSDKQTTALQCDTNGQLILAP